MPSDSRLRAEATDAQRAEQEWRNRTGQPIMATELAPVIRRHQKLG